MMDRENRPQPKDVPGSFTVETYGMALGVYGVRVWIPSHLTESGYPKCERLGPFMSRTAARKRGCKRAHELSKTARPKYEVGGE